MFIVESSPAPLEIKLIIAGISVIIYFLSRWFQKRFAMDQKGQIELQTKIQDLKDRMNEVRGDYEQMAILNQKMMLLMREMSKKQFIPMLIRSVVWYGIFWLLKLIFAQYNEFLSFNLVFGRTLFSLYLLVTLSISLVVLIFNFIRKKIKPEDVSKKEEYIVDHLRALDQNLIINEGKEDEETNPMLNENNNTSFDSTASQTEKNAPTSSKTSKSWKTRLND